MNNLKIYSLIDKKNLSYKKDFSKKIYVYTPKGYNYKNGKDYSVIYLFDGQNGFDIIQKDYKCSAKESWCANKLADENKIIIVGIDNGEGFMVRDKELTMGSFGKLTNFSEGGNFQDGRLDDLGGFIIETLMPFIKEKYNVSGLKENNILMGASSGGLASFYLGLKYADLFGKIFTLSPAICLFYKKDWVSFLSGLDLKNNNQSIVIYCGKNTDDQLEQTLYLGKSPEICGAKDLKQLLLDNGKNDGIKEFFIDGAYHNEFYWKTAIFEFFNK